jgi:hypothetical protein
MQIKYRSIYKYEIKCNGLFQNRWIFAYCGKAVKQYKGGRDDIILTLSFENLFFNVFHEILCYVLFS